MSQQGGGQGMTPVRGDQRAIHVKMTCICLPNNHLLEVYAEGSGDKEMSKMSLALKELWF